MPDGVALTVWQDQTRVLRSRLDLLIKNGRAGFVLVVLVLALFLRLRLAGWVSLGIPISFLGALALMPTMGVSINLISLFAFILVLGIVVDDAIIVGENVYTRFQRGEQGLRAAIRGRLRGAQAGDLRRRHLDRRLRAAAGGTGHHRQDHAGGAADRHRHPGLLADRVAAHPAQPPLAPARRARPRQPAARSAGPGRGSRSASPTGSPG